MNKECPKCGFTSSHTEIHESTECPQCGVVFYKYEAALQRAKDNEYLQGKSTKQIINEDISPPVKKIKNLSWGGKSDYKILILMVGAVIAIALFFYLKIKPVEIQGQVFVATKGGESIKLPLVAVSAYLAKDVENQFQSLARSEEVQRANLYKNISESSNREKYEDYKYKVQLKYITGINHFINSLKNPMKIEKTDADGIFKMLLPPGKYFLTATAKRQVFDGTEEYEWAVQVSVDSSTSKIYLSNDNMIETGCEQCAKSPFEDYTNN